METNENRTSRRSARFGLRLRIALLTGGSCALVALFLVVAFVRQVNGLMEEELRKRGQVVTQQLASNLAFETFSGDRVGLQAAVASSLRDVPDLTYAVIRDGSGRILAFAAAADLQVTADTLPAVTVAADGAGERRGEVAGLDTLSFASTVIFEEKRQQETDLLDPLFAGGAIGEEPPEQRTIGTVQTGFRIDGLQTRMAAVTRNAAVLGLVVLLGCMLAALLVTRLLTVPIERLAFVASSIAEGDLSQKLELDSGSDEISGLARSFDTMAARLRTLIADLREASSEVEREAATILTTATQQSTMASQQATAINETSTTASEIAQTSQAATEHADGVIAIAQRSEDLTQDGQRAVEETVLGMEKLGEQVKAIAHSITELSERTLQIGDIIATVKDLAEQSNLLALNASIEAAKAGEHGRGFAVVAMEMRSLAEQSKLAAQQVRGILGEVQRSTRDAVIATEEGSKRAQAGVALAQTAGRTIDGLGEVIRESSVAARQIAANTRQQTIGVEQIVGAINDLSAAMSDSVAGTRQIEQVAANLSTLAARLSSLVNRYQV